MRNSCSIYWKKYKISDIIEALVLLQVKEYSKNMFKKFILYLILLTALNTNKLMAQGKDFSEFIIPAGNDLRAILTGDFDHNNISDLAICDYKLNCVHILMGNETREFTYSYYSVGQNPVAMTSGDFNNDGNIDLVIANSALNNLSFLFGTDEGNFIINKLETINNIVNISLLSSGDFNGDRNLDLLIAGEKTLLVLPGKGDGTFKESIKYPEVQNPSHLTVDDFNLDGISDIALIDTTIETSPKEIPHIKSTANRGKEIIVITGGKTLDIDHFKGGVGNPGYLISSYYNDDIYPDLIISNPDFNQITVLLNLGNGRFGERINIKTGLGPLGIDIKDINGDGLLDIITANSLDNTLSIINNLNKVISYKTGPNPARIVTGDFNGDNNIDIVSIPTDKPYLYITWGLGKGDFYDGIAGLTGSCPLAICKGDFNQDGITDLVTANALSNNLSILLGTSIGTFYGWTLKTREYPCKVITEDFNKDGFLDLAVVNKLYNGISVLLGNGQGEFKEIWFTKTGKRTIDITSGDFNSDGNKDIAVANSKSNNISVLIGNGDGTFQKGDNYEIPSEPVKITCGDFNGDNIEDIAVAKNLSNTVTIIPGKGDGTFNAPLEFTSGGNPVFLLATDLNKDGITDLITANYNSRTLDIFSGDRKNFLLKTQTIELKGSPISIETVMTDIIVSCEENLIIIIKDFKEISEYITENSPTSLIAGNFLVNKELYEKNDIIFLNKEDPYITMLINNSKFKNLELKREIFSSSIKESKELMDKGSNYKAEKNFFESIECYERALKLNPFSKKIYYCLGTVYEEKDEIEKASELYIKAMNLITIYSPEEDDIETELNSHLGHCYYRLGKIEEAKKLCWREKDKSPLALFTLGLIYKESEEPSQALKAFKEYINLFEGVFWKGSNKTIEAKEFIVELEEKSLGHWSFLVEGLDNKDNKEVKEKLKLYKNYKTREALLNLYRKELIKDRSINERLISALEEILSDNVKEPWTKYGYSTKDNDTWQDPFKKNTLYIAPGDKNDKSLLYKSEDGGISWYKLLKTDNMIKDIYVIKNEPNIIIALTEGYNSKKAHHSIIRSDNGGITWDEVLKIPSSVKEITYSSPENVYALTEEGLFTSKDTGISWHLCGFDPLPEGKQLEPVSKSSSLMSKIKHWAEAIPENNKINIEKIFSGPGGKIFVLLSKNEYTLDKELLIYNYLIVSKDSGNSWESIKWPEDLDINSASRGNYKNIYWYKTGKRTEIISLNEKGELYIKYNKNMDLHKTSDEGKHWEIIQSIPGNKIYNIDIDKENPISIRVNTPKGYFKSTDGGFTWK
ncbi:MAG: FG-GAP repeat protein [bacterium ADurb.Bin363]|nr:MAG: FG-GAP repeat protein [bacterium ADurb.Bin363]